MAINVHSPKHLDKEDLALLPDNVCTPEALDQWLDQQDLWMKYHAMSDFSRETYQIKARSSQTRNQAHMIFSDALSKSFGEHSKVGAWSYVIQKSGETIASELGFEPGASTTRAEFIGISRALDSIDRGEKVRLWTHRSQVAYAIRWLLSCHQTHPKPKQLRRNDDLERGLRYELKRDDFHCWLLKDGDKGEARWQAMLSANRRMIEDMIDAMPGLVQMGAKSMRIRRDESELRAQSLALKQPKIVEQKQEIPFNKPPLSTQPAHLPSPEGPYGDRGAA